MSKAKISAKEFWKLHFGEYPQNDAEKLAVSMMQEYAHLFKADESPIKEDGEQKFTLNEMIDTYNAGEAAGDFDRQRKQRGALFSEYFKTKFHIDVRRGKKIV